MAAARVGCVTADPPGGLLVGVDVAETYVHVDLFDTTLTRLAGVEETLHPGSAAPTRWCGTSPPAV